MTRKHTWNSAPNVVAVLIAILSVFIVARVLAQVPAGQPPDQISSMSVSTGAEQQGMSPLALTLPSFVAVRTYGLGYCVQCRVVVADVNLDGKPDFVVVNDNGPYAYPSRTSVEVLLGNGDGIFQPAVSYDAGPSGGVSVAVADVNSDGKPDLVVGNLYFTGVFLGNGDGTFQPMINLTSGGGYVAIADLNGDGFPDLVVNSSVLVGNGDGTFQNPVFYESGGNNVDGVAIADLNHDGKADLVVTNKDSNNVGVLLGKGDGTFQQVVTYDLAYGSCCSPVVADVNGDGKPDLVISSGFTVSVLLGNGDGTFQPAVTTATGASGPLPGVGSQFPLSVAVADVNGDGKPDLLVPNRNTTGPNGVLLLLGNGDGTFQAAMFYDSGGEWPEAVATADVTRDGKSDLVVVNETTPNGGGNVGVLLNNTGAPTATTVLVSSLNPAPTGHTVTYTATVESQSGGPVTGFVMFHEGSYTFANVPLVNSQAAASIKYFTGGNTLYFNGGAHSITGTYLGDLQNAGSSATIVEYVSSVQSKTVLNTSESPSFVNQPVTFTVTVTPAHGTIPNGELVTFYDGLTPLGSVPLAGGAAVFTTSSLSVKSHFIKATYAGDTTFKPSSGSVQQVVKKYTTTTALVSNLNPSVYEQAVTFMARVTRTGPYPLTGKVVFRDGTTWIGVAMLNGGVATRTKSNLAVGTHSITAQYLGDAYSAGSTSSVLTQVVH